MLLTIDEINASLEAQLISEEQAVRSTLALLSQGTIEMEDIRSRSAKSIVEQIDNVSLRIAEDL